MIDPPTNLEAETPIPKPSSPKPKTLNPKPQNPGGALIRTL